MTGISCRQTGIVKILAASRDLGLDKQSCIYELPKNPLSILELGCLNSPFPKKALPEVSYRSGWLEIDGKTMVWMGFMPNLPGKPWQNTPPTVDGQNPFAPLGHHRKP